MSLSLSLSSPFTAVYSHSRHLKNCQLSPVIYSHFQSVNQFSAISRHFKLFPANSSHSTYTQMIKQFTAISTLLQTFSVISGHFPSFPVISSHFQTIPDISRPLRWFLAMSSHLLEFQEEKENKNAKRYYVMLKPKKSI